MTPGSAQDGLIMPDDIRHDIWHDAIDVLAGKSNPANGLDTEQGKAYECAFTI